MNVGQSLTLTAVGDIIQTRPITQYAESDEDIKRLINLIRQSDVGVGNLETLIHDFEGYPAASSGGTYMRSPPSILDDLKSMGFNLFAAATNHTFDYSHGGIETTIRNLDEKGIAYAGIGSNLYEARKPGYTETNAGRIGIVSACTSFPPGSEAGKQTQALHGRPGLNPLRVSKVYNLPDDELNTLKRISEIAGIEAVKQDWLDRGIFVNHNWDDDKYFYFGDLQFSSDKQKRGITHDVDPNDMEAWTRSIREADRNSNWVIASVHSHQGIDGLTKTSETPPFLIDIAHQAVDAGADVVISHGPHVLRGIEMYNKRPIFYSLGNFIIQNETVSRLPPESFSRYGLTDYRFPSEVFQSRLYDSDNNEKGDLADDRFWKTVIPLIIFTADKLEIKLYPCTLQQTKPRPQRGIPKLATGAQATEILEHIADLSCPFDTQIELQQKYGLIHQSF